MKRGLRVLRMACRIPPMPGGMEQHVARLCTELDARGVATRLYYEQGETPAGERVEGFRSRWRIRSGWPEPVRELRFALATLLHLLFRGGTGFDVVHTHGGWMLALLGRWMARWQGAVAFHSVHGAVPLRGLRSWGWRAALRRDVQLLGVSREIVETLGPLCGGDAAMRSSGFDPAVFHPPTDAIPARPPWQVVSVGRLHPMKGHDVLVRAAAACVARGLPLELTIVGPGPEEARLRELATREGLPVRFVGARPAAEVADLLRRSHLFALASRCLPGHSEGTPTVVLEALACGVPVVGTAVGGLGELIESTGGGLVVRPEDVTALADALQRMLEDEGLRTACRTIALPRVARDSWQRVADDVLSRYLRAWDERADSRRWVALEERT